MKVNENDIAKILAEMPEIELPEGFHDEVMQKLKAEAAGPKLGKPKAKKKSRAIWYAGSFAAVAAAAVFAAVMLVSEPNFTADAEPAPLAMAAPTPMPEMAAAAAEPEAPMAPFAADAPIGRMDAQIWVDDYYGEMAMEIEADFHLYEWADAVFSMLSEPEGRYALNIGIMIEPYDMAYAQSRLIELSGFDDAAMLVSTDFDNFPEVFMFLLSLGHLADYHMPPTEIWEGEDVIFITLLHNQP